MFQKHKDKIKQTIDQLINNTRKMKESHDERVAETIEQRNDNIIQCHIQKLSTRSHRPYYIENSVRDCINDIAKAEGDSRMAPGYQYLSEWSK
ncbi:MAG TPA: hypothetical protein VN328_12855, partial [Thermodesulfovibrionales bacterium]|nr:hypothetical protein [Thermodesulfovibrionales bacterium]